MLTDILNICIPYFIVTCLITLTSYLAGRSICKIFKLPVFTGIYLNLFIKTLIGSCFLITLISIIYTGGKTIHLVFILLSLFLYYEWRITKKQNLPQEEIKMAAIFNRKNILSLLSFLLIIFLWQARILLKSDSQFLNGIEPDNYYYAEISKCLISTGQENSLTTANLINEQYHFATPYHYYDLWLNGFVSKLFNLSAALSLYLITYTFFTFLFLIG